MIAEELAELRSWIGDPPRHPDQTHGINESDAEVVRLRPDLYLATSADAVEEEIAAGLYRDPFTIGWITAMAGLSDIAAVGAEPVGVLLTSIWGPEWDTAAREGVAAGFGEALRRSGTALLGGDTGSTACTVLSATAVGWSSEPPMRRLGCRPGDVLCATGRTGAGACLAIRWLAGEDPSAFPEEWFRPQARLAEGVRLRPLANACTDASDGLVHAVDTLAALNGLGAALRWNPDTLDPRATEYLTARGLPLWLAWVVELSDFELVVALPPEQLERARAEVTPLEPIGRVTDGPGLTIEIDGAEAALGEELYPSLARTPAGERAAAYAELLAAIHERGLP